MKCKICGNESGKYPLCRTCNAKKEQGLIIKCAKCGNWHYKDVPCVAENLNVSNEEQYCYNLKRNLITKSEQGFFHAIQASLPEGYFVFPQINLASFIYKTDDSKFHNELFRNVDFLITDAAYAPKIVIEINDQTHLNADRKERDEKVKNICEEAGIPIMRLWTSYGINNDYIKNKICEVLNAPSAPRVHHFSQSTIKTPITVTGHSASNRKKNGCYIATCVYGSYDCPQVWSLRRFRDDMLKKHWYGRAFIRFYYSISPILVKWFGNKNWFKSFWRSKLDCIVKHLNTNGVADTPYIDE